MTPFLYTRARSLPQALTAAGEEAAPVFLAGGTCLLDLMKQGVERPSRIVDLSFAPDLASVSVEADGQLRVGATAVLSHVARMRVVSEAWPLLAQTIVAGLTPQLRNAATFGGNILQRPRCVYFREPDFACNKKRPGSGCAARDGVHFAHAILGAGLASPCIAVHPSDLCVALTALDAVVEIHGRSGMRRTPIEHFLRLVGDDPTREAEIAAGELVTAISLPPQASKHAVYVKGPEEGFALVSAAVVLGMKSKTIGSARIVLGGVAHKPWRAHAAETALTGFPIGEQAADRAAKAILADLQTDVQTSFRRTLLRSVLREAFERVEAIDG